MKRGMCGYGGGGVYEEQCRTLCVCVCYGVCDRVCVSVSVAV